MSHSIRFTPGIDPTNEHRRLRAAYKGPFGALRFDNLQAFAVQLEPDVYAVQEKLPSEWDVPLRISNVKVVEMRRFEAEPEPRTTGRNDGTIRKTP